MATRRLKFKPKPVVGLAVRRAKDGTDTPTDVGSGPSEESRGSPSEVHGTSSSAPPINSEVKESSSATEDDRNACLGSKNSQSVELHYQNNEITPRGNDLLSSPSEKESSSQSGNRHSSSSEINPYHNILPVEVSGVSDVLLTSNSTTENSENVLHQTGGNSSSINKGSGETVITQSHSHSSEIHNNIIGSHIHNSESVILNNKRISSVINNSLASEYRSININLDSSNVKQQSNDTVENRESAEALSSEIVKPNSMSENSKPVVLVYNERVVKSEESIATSSRSMVTGNNDLTTFSGNKIVQNPSDSTAKPSSREITLKSLFRLTRLRCKPVVASSIARRKNEEISRNSPANSDNNQEIMNTSNYSLNSAPNLASDRPSEVSDSVTESDDQTKPISGQTEEENSRTDNNILESVQHCNADELVTSQISKVIEDYGEVSSEKIQGVNNDNVNNIVNSSNRNQNSSDDLVSCADDAVVDVNTIIDIVDNSSAVDEDNTAETNTITQTVDSSALDNNTDVPSTTTTFTTTINTATTTVTTESLIAELKSFKYKSYRKTKRHHRTHGASYSKMGHDTIDSLKKKFGNALPDKTQLKMKDLIFYNPKTNPMSNAVMMKKPLSSIKGAETESAVEEILEEQRVDDVGQEEQEREREREASPPAPAAPVPQLKIGPDGQIILDPKSLIIETTEMQRNRQNLENSEIVLETEGKYGCYSKKRNTRHDWRPEETLQFYRALHTIGTDFTLMATLFPKRTRRELKLKFKYEEKYNLQLVDKAITNPREFDFEQLESDFRKENEERARMEAEEIRVKEQLKKHKELLKQQRQEMLPKRYPKKSPALKEFNAEDIGEFQDEKKKKNPSKKRKRKKEDEPAGDEWVQEMIFDYDRIDRLCREEDTKNEKNKNKKDEKKQNSTKKSRVNNKTVRLSKVNSDKKDDNNRGEDDKDDEEDIIGNILTTTRSGRKPKRSKNKMIEETPSKKYVKPRENSNKKLPTNYQEAINKYVSSTNANEVITTLPRHNEIDDHNSESNVSSLSAELDESFMNQVNRYNAEDLTASVTRLTGRLEKRMGQCLSGVEKQTPPAPPPPPSITNPSSSPLPSFSTLTPGIHNSRALSESMKIIDQLTSDVETACVEMTEDQLIEIIDEASLSEIENENILIEDTAIRASSTSISAFEKTNSIISVRDSSDHNNEKHKITIIALEFPQRNLNSKKNTENTDTSNEDGSSVGDGDNSVSLIVPHYEVITGDMLGEEVAYFSSDAGTNLLINRGQQSGTEGQTYFILEETTVEECSRQEDANNKQQEQPQQRENMLMVEDVTHTEESECILGE